MRTTLIVAALGWLALGGAASAQVTGIVTQSAAQLSFNPADGIGVNGVFNYAGSNETGLICDGEDSTTNYKVSTVLAPNDIQFANGGTATGAYAYSSTTTSIAVSFTNDGPLAVTPQLESTILPGASAFMSTTPAAATCPAPPAVPRSGPRRGSHEQSP